MLDHLVLGKLIKSYHHATPGSRTPGFLHALALLAIISPFGYGLYRSVYGYFKFGIVAAYSWGRPWFLASLLAGLLFAIYIMVRHIRSKSNVYFYEKGIQVSRYRQEPQSLLWKDIKYIFEDSQQTSFFWLPVGENYAVRIVSLDGRELYIQDSLSNIGELIQRIKAKTFPRLRNSIISKFQDGSDISFGPITISLNYLELNADQYPWSRLKDIHIGSGKLVIELQNQQRITFPVKDIPNIEILLQLLVDGISY